MKVLSILVPIAIAACSVDPRDGGGNDVLPKRGELADDPTIVSAHASCGLTFDHRHVVNVYVGATDPMGDYNLGTCTGTLDARTVEGTFRYTEYCYLELEPGTCTVGEQIVVDLVVSNSTGGATSASIKLTTEEE